MKRNWWLLLGLLPLLIACRAPAGQPPDTTALTPAAPTVVAEMVTPTAAVTASLSAAATSQAVVSAVTPTPVLTPMPPPPVPTDTPAAAAATATPFPSPTALPTAESPSGDSTFTATPTATPGRAQPATQPTVGYTPTNTYQVQRLLVGSGQPGRLYAWLTGFGWGDHLAERLLVSDDLGATWQPFEGGNVQPAGIDYATGALYGNTGGGLARWDGTSWHPVSQQQITKLLVQFGEPQKMWAISEAQVGRSEDGGQTWRLEAGSGVPLDLFLNPQKPGYIYEVAHVWGQHNLSRSTGNHQWDLLPKPDNPGEPVGTWRDIRGVAVDGDSGATYLALANIISSFNPTGSQLWRSDNLNTPDVRQVSWTLLADYGPETQMQLLASGWNPDGPGPALYANIRPEYCPPEGGTCDPEPPWVLHRSLDGGQTWKPVAIPGTAHE
ncbi:MAG: hypothetical protein R2844_14840 [Caldilineales bacterium]